MSPDLDFPDFRPSLVSTKNDGNPAMAGSGETERPQDDAHRSAQRACLGRLLSGETAREARDRDA